METEKETTPVKTEATPTSVVTDIKADGKTTVSPTSDTKATTANAEKSGTTGDSKNDIPKGVKKELYKLREKIREMTNSNKSSNTNTTNVTPTINTETEEETDILSDPNKWANKLTQRVIGEIDKKLSLAQLEQKLTVERQQAIDYLSSQKELVDEDFREELVGRLSSPEYIEIEKVSPLKAARLAYMDMLESRGINGVRDTSVKKNISAENTSVSSSTSSSGKKIYSRKEIEKILTENPEKFSEIKQAIKEGRVK